MQACMGKHYNDDTNIRVYWRNYYSPNTWSYTFPSLYVNKPELYTAERCMCNVIIVYVFRYGRWVFCEAYCPCQIPEEPSAYQRRTWRGSGTRHQDGCHHRQDGRPQETSAISHHASGFYCFSIYTSVKSSLNSFQISSPDFE